ncbi:MAM (Meprin, A5-protein, PTPmu) domain protein [Ditylenchus destructor]|uniref:MAM (Meprin, A5-protein, PTPmu) domain protein n=1 Tax=Ditylenchus destructor TaxID=166010 RepID=A0AAD4R7I5_9BILA|nr:MAM (Meprin, A5-protein, PTPmu) domain protein [Ditylenchus destructor]
MPGYEAERAKLRQYLGIEWTPNGLTKMDAQKPKPIRRPEELNCDFTSPDHCKWHNVANLDSLDYHLFRKEDNTEFPAIQVRPGPSKIQVGDQMIFVGDRRREEKSAIISSWPIRCQNATGKLTFTFWIYNGARVEVLILEEDPKAKDHALRILPEKPYIDCGTVTVNTECTAEILPREQPFRIAIRAYDISHPDGSFIMIDNIFYEAQFCKVSIDFGPDFQTEPLMTADDGQSIQTASQLACHDFDKNCRWRNAGGHTHSVGGKDDNIVDEL